MSKMSAGELEAFMAREFPQMDYLNIQVDEVRDRYLRIRLPYDDRHLRPGGTVAGPTMMALADCAVWLAIIATAGKFAEAVTTNLNINFLSRPEPGDMYAEAELLKMGRRLAVGEVGIYSVGREEPVAHAVLTYALPSGG
jgi:uncharacterized protein (TIGR00369 family)